ncbi:hypothetical protein NIIDMKKI_17810 [Mycobacterium kansasii]|uniref:Uncharacterized protein n=1 Tax=Mycobacterium kansasii TaxID=1768 RepID=A0A7G1IA34_MYCKA|nr:hypothetical protein NIIDMKKI_17810 [Mycobacterium kansasii]
MRPVRRPVSPGSDDEFDLYYVRTGRKSTHPLVIIPEGREWRRCGCIRDCAGAPPRPVWT